MERLVSEMGVSADRALGSRPSRGHHWTGAEKRLRCRPALHGGVGILLTDGVPVNENRIDRFRSTASQFVGEPVEVGKVAAANPL